MFERMLSETPPSVEDIENMLGDSLSLIKRFEESLSKSYELKRELRFPFGKNYGWGYKYSHRNSHLCYVFFETGAFTVTIQIGDKSVPGLEAQLEKMLPITRELWDGRYPCGDKGGWIHYRVCEEDELADTLSLINIKKPPNK